MANSIRTNSDNPPCGVHYWCGFYGHLDWCLKFISMWGKVPMKLNEREALRQRSMYGLSTERLLAHLLANTKAGIPLSSGLEKSFPDGTWEVVHAIDTIDIEMACYYRIHIKEAKPWFYRIPVGGILCWVKPEIGEFRTAPYCTLITEYTPEGHTFTGSMGDEWDDQIPTPLTGNEVEVFLRSARLIETGQLSK